MKEHAAIIKCLLNIDSENPFDRRQWLKITLFFASAETTHKLSQAPLKKLPTPFSNKIKTAGLM
jgi:hypothetical protein